MHGGPDYDRPVRVDADVLARLTALEPLAPLHQPHNLAPIRLAQEIDPEMPQVACFDTAFHRGHPPHTDCYALPRALYDEGVRRYGFHGLSYEYVAERLRTVAPDVAGGRVIVAHLGSGVSMCGLRDGRSVESTMGFTALDGLPMGTRPGQLDPGVVLYLIEQRGMSRRRGDRPALQAARASRASRASPTTCATCWRATSPARPSRSTISSIAAGLMAGLLAAALGGLDAFVFTAGIGENSAPIRARIAERLAWLGAELDPAANAAGAGRISTPSSRVALLVVPTDEELMIARHTSRSSAPGRRLNPERRHDPSRRAGEAARRPQGPDRRHRQRPLDRLGLRPRLPRASGPSSRSPTSTTRRSRMSSRWRARSRRRSSCRWT